MEEEMAAAGRVGSDVKVEWMPGHSTWMDVLSRKVTTMQHVGNAMADSAAKEARSWAEGLAPGKL